MSYRFRMNKINNYEWKSIIKNSFEGEFYRYTKSRLDLELKLQELLLKSKEAYSFANNLFDTISDEDSNLYEEVDFKLNNCKFFIENKFNEKANEILKGIYCSEATYDRFVEILDTYTEMTVRGYDRIMEDKLNQIGRIATGIFGLLDDLQFTLELNGLFDLKDNTILKTSLLDVKYDCNEIRREKPELILEDRELICA